MSFLGSGNPQIFPKSNTPQTVAGRKRPEELPPLVGIEYQKEFFVIMGNRRFFAYKECGMDLEFKMILHSEDYTTLENQEEREAFKFKVEFPGPVETAEWVLPQECGKEFIKNILATSEQTFPGSLSSGFSLDKLNASSEPICNINK